MREITHFRSSPRSTVWPITQTNTMSYIFESKSMKKPGYTLKYLHPFVHVPGFAHEKIHPSEQTNAADNRLSMISGNLGEFGFAGILKKTPVISFQSVVLQSSKSPRHNHWLRKKEMMSNKLFPVNTISCFSSGDFAFNWIVSTQLLWIHSSQMSPFIFTLFSQTWTKRKLIQTTAGDHRIPLRMTRTELFYVRV